MMQSKQKEDLRPYRMFGLTLLQLMVVLGVTGFVLTAVLNYLF
jgi:type II secretory pathway pseudopilin PulG